MPDRKNPHLLRTKARAIATPSLRLAQRIAASDEAPEITEQEKNAAAATAVLKRADAELPTLVRQVATALRLSAPATLTEVSDLSVPGSTVKLGLDFPGRTMIVWNASEILRFSSGKTSIRLNGPGGAVWFHLEMPDPSAGIYLAIIHAGGNAPSVSVGCRFIPGESAGDIVPRSGEDRFLFPFEVGSGTRQVHLQVQLPSGVSGDVKLYRVDITRVT